jgi:hypothetical protein
MSLVVRKTTKFKFRVFELLTVGKCQKCAKGYINNKDMAWIFYPL